MIERQLIEHEIGVIKSYRVLTRGLKNKKFFSLNWNDQRKIKAIELNLLRKLKNKLKKEV